MTALPHPILVIGSGLLGTSVGLALSQRGHQVLLSDRNPDAVRTASGLGAGTPYAGERVGLVVVATPPEFVGSTVLDALRQHPEAVVTDVGSVKVPPLRLVADETGAARYVGGHPMAGSERSGALAGSALLFEGRPWAITPHRVSDEAAVAAVVALAEECGAVTVVLDAATHDEAVARTSHVPYLVSVLMAGQLAGAPSDHLTLAGQGVRDVTRVAASDPELWSQIVGDNAEAIAPVLRAIQGELAQLLTAVETGDRSTLKGALAQGVAGTQRVPGKHGGPALALGVVYVVVPDRPGELARLFSDVGAIGTNIEDMRIDHDPGRAYGLAELQVAADQADSLCGALESRGWAAHR